MTVPHFVGLGHILQGTNLVATVPERRVQRLAEPFGLTYLPHPTKLPDVAINVFWHAKMHRSSVNQWLRGLVFDLFATTGVVPRQTSSERRRCSAMARADGLPAALESLLQ